MRVVVAGEELELFPEHAIFWPRLGAVLVADLHWGKAAAFRAGGLPVPVGTTSDNLASLDAVLSRTGASRLFILGDLLHSRSGRAPRTLEAVARWRERWAGLSVQVVRGNHDRRAGDPPAEWGFDCLDEPAVVGLLALRHYPEPTPGLYTLAGHLHPAVTLTGPGRQRLRLPCWHFGPEVGVLPACGSFTGSALVRPRAGDRVFVAADGEVIAVGGAPGPR
jgi:DNA ligase-associated metallophosphoesterase